MAIYVDPPKPGRWFGRFSEPKEGATPDRITVLALRLSKATDLARNNQELDDELHHSVMSQALTYEAFLYELNQGKYGLKDDGIEEAVKTVQEFCELIEAELGQAPAAAT